MYGDTYNYCASRKGKKINQTVCYMRLRDGKCKEHKGGCRPIKRKGDKNGKSTNIE